MWISPPTARMYGFELLSANEQLQASDDGTLVVSMRRSVNDERSRLND
jgi:hypothetical protein